MVSVSVVCITYNHEKYIEKALESFVTQKTNFPFEIIVHDDASTDGTADIIRRYEKEYPHLVKPIYETENQYHKKNWSSIKKQYVPMIKGKYIAICEGDDYWIDDHKLQKQFDYMEAHPDCSFCGTDGYEESGSKRGKTSIFAQTSEGKALLNNKENRFGGPEMIRFWQIPTASYFLRTSDMAEIPEIPKNCFSGDLFVQIYLASKGYCHCLIEPCCVYRRRVSGSLTDQWRKNSTIRIKYINSVINLMDYMDGYTEYKYHEDFVKEKEIMFYEKAKAEGNSRALRNSHSFQIAKQFGKKEILRYLAASYFPLLYEWQRKIRRCS